MTQGETHGISNVEMVSILSFHFFFYPRVFILNNVLNHKNLFTLLIKYNPLPLARFLLIPGKSTSLFFLIDQFATRATKDRKTSIGWILWINKAPMEGTIGFMNELQKYM